MSSRGGFSLIEVVAAILILGLAAAVVIAYLGVDMNTGTRAVEKMRAWGVLRRTVDGWTHQAPDPPRGERISDGFRIRWQWTASEPPRPVIAGGGNRNTVQLGTLHLEVYKPGSSDPIMHRTVLVNRWRSRGTP